MSFLTIIEVEHPERAEQKGSVMFASNHLSSYDGIILQLVIPRTICFMSKAELFRNPLARWFLNMAGSFPVKRGEFDRQAMLNAKNVMESGFPLMMFPEGTRTYGRGMVEARSGTAHLAMRNHCTIIPVALEGSQNILKNGLKRTKVRVIFYEPVEPDEKETARALTDRLMRVVASRLSEPLRGFYA